MPGYGWSQAPKKPGFDISAGRRDQRRADGQARLRALRRAGRRLGRDRDRVDRPRRSRALRGHPHEHARRRSARGRRQSRWRACRRRSRRGSARWANFQKNETGYQQIQGTKPQTLGYGLNDSPAGLAAWIVEKFRTWSDCNGDVESRFTKDELLTNVMIYWVTQSITSSTRLYYETMKRGPLRRRATRRSTCRRPARSSRRSSTRRRASGPRRRST